MAAIGQCGSTRPCMPACQRITQQATVAMMPGGSYCGGHLDDIESGVARGADHSYRFTCTAGRGVTSGTQRMYRRTITRFTPGNRNCGQRPNVPDDTWRLPEPNGGKR